MAFTYVNETIGGRLRSLSNSSCFVFYGIGGVIINIYAYWLNSYWDFYVLMLVGNLIATLGFFFMVKTPFYCLEKKDYQGFKQSILYIARKNGKLSNGFESNIDEFVNLKQGLDRRQKRSAFVDFKE